MDKKPRFPFGIVSTVFTALALVGVFSNGLDIELLPVLDAIVSAYQRWIEIVFGWWINPILERLIYLVGRYLNISLAIQPHSLDLFVFLWAYFSIFASVTFRLNRLGWLAVFYLSVGFFVALLAVATFGIVEVDRPEMGFVLPLAFVFSISLFSYATSLRAAILFPPDGKGFSDAFLQYSRHATRYWVVGLLILGIAYWLVDRLALWSGFSNVLAIGVLLLAALFFLLGLYRFLLGPYQGNMHSTEGAFLQKRWDSGEGRTGYFMIVVVISAASVLLLNVLGVK